MSETDELRRMLDERGVEWYARNILSTAYVHWGDDRKRPTFDAKDAGGGKVDLFCYRISPEQAIEATLGRGTCHDAAMEGEWFECSECGTVKQLIHPHYCPNCGAKVVDE